MSQPLLSVHATDAYPIIQFQPQAAVPGYAAQWIADMDKLLAAALPFAIIYPEGPHAEAHEDRKVRGQWLKQHRDVLAAQCRALVSVEPDADKRAALSAQLEGLRKAFGVPQAVAATQAQAVALAQAYIDGKSPELGTAAA